MKSTIRRDILKGWDVLVVDDEVDSLEVASRVLAHYGATVHSANNGQEGLEQASRAHPRLIITDLSMPVLDGWGLIYELRQVPATAKIPVIALTAHAMVGDRARTIEAGFLSYITKPLAASQFIKDLLAVIAKEPTLAALIEGEPT